MSVSRDVGGRQRGLDCGQRDVVGRRKTDGTPAVTTRLGDSEVGGERRDNSVCDLSLESTVGGVSVRVVPQASVRGTS